MSADAAAPLDASHKASWQLGSLTANGSNLGVANNGHSVQVFWQDPAFEPYVSLVVQGEASCACAVSNVVLSESAAHGCMRICTIHLLFLLNITADLVPVCRCAAAALLLLLCCCCCWHLLVLVQPASLWRAASY
jgi:hypothetical protein